MVYGEDGEKDTDKLQLHKTLNINIKTTKASK